MHKLKIDLKRWVTDRNWFGYGWFIVTIDGMPAMGSWQRNNSKFVTAYKIVRDGGEVPKHLLEDND